jgi:hypothetical protein
MILKDMIVAIFYCIPFCSYFFSLMYIIYDKTFYEIPESFNLGIFNPTLPLTCSYLICTGFICFIAAMIVDYGHNARF